MPATRVAVIKPAMYQVRKVRRDTLGSTPIRGTSSTLWLLMPWPPSGPLETTRKVSQGREQADCLPGLRDGPARHLPGPLRAAGQDPLDGLVGELRPGLAAGREGFDDPLGQDLLLLEAAHLRLPAELPVVLPVVRKEDLVERIHVAALGMPWLGLVYTLGVGDHRQHLLADDLRLSRHPDDVAQRLRHLLLAVGAQDLRCRGPQRGRLREELSVDPVE